MSVTFRMTWTFILATGMLGKRTTPKLLQLLLLFSVPFQQIPQGVGIQQLSTKTHRKSERLSKGMVAKWFETNRPSFESIDLNSVLCFTTFNMGYVHSILWRIFWSTNHLLKESKITGSQGRTSESLKRKKTKMRRAFCGWKPVRTGTLFTLYIIYYNARIYWKRRFMKSNSWNYPWVLHKKSHM